ncbi:MAG: serine/threonine-protein kinase [Myxococcota bacterium]|nr:serine/threonine-protein kinase [Myxococcota bacterium]
MSIEPLYCPRCKDLLATRFCKRHRRYGVSEKGLQQRDDNFIGTFLNERYGITVRLGMGGMGAVYKAYDEQKKGWVAIKVLREVYAKHGAIRDRFVREAEAGASLDHPNIVPLTDFGVDKDGKLWLAMAFVDGWTLRDEINNRGPFSVKDAIEVTRQVLMGLAEAHDAGLIHRDLKHDNIMFSGNRKNFTIRIVDFGVVKSHSADLVEEEAAKLLNFKTIDLPKSEGEGGDGVLGPKVLTAMGMMVGSPSYMAPEQIRGLPVGPPADLYAVAVVIYEILTARRLFAVNDYEGLLREDAKREAKLLVFTAKGELIPESFARLIDRTLAHDPTDRFPDAHTMLLALDQLDKREARFPGDLFCDLPERSTELINNASPELNREELLSETLPVTPETRSPVIPQRAAPEVTERPREPMLAEDSLHAIKSAPRPLRFLLPLIAAGLTWLVTAVI